MPGRLDRYREMYFTGRESERIVFFSDAVFAIAMTLLVLEIKVPELPPEAVRSGELAGALVEQVPHLFGYVLSFMFVGLTWMGHHNVWRWIRRYDARLMWLNVLLLLFIALLPVPTELIAFYGPTTRVAPIAYALTVSVVGYLQVVIWAYARRHHFLSDEVEPDMYVMVRRGLVVSPTVFLASAVLAIWLPTVAMISWSSTWVVFAVSNRQVRAVLRRHDAEAEAAEPVQDETGPAPTTVR